MGTVVTFDVAAAGAGDAEVYRALAEARARLHHADALFSLWKPNSPMSAIRRGELAVADAPRDIALVLERCRDYRELTHGWFDHEAMPGGVDPTGIVKGWAAERARDALSEAGFHDVMVNAGGDIATAGGPVGGRWRIGIQHPRIRTHLLGVCEVDSAIATSGSYQRGAHLYDPFRRRYANAFLSATVVGPELTVADALATALAVAGPEGLSFIEELAGYEALAITGKGEVYRSSRCPIRTASSGS